MTRTFVRPVPGGAAMAVLAVAALVWVGSRAGGTAESTIHARPSSVRLHEVRAGETLWGIARRLAGPEADPRPVVDALMSVNGLAGPGIVPGQVLRLPPPP